MSSLPILFSSNIWHQGLGLTIKINTLLNIFNIVDESVRECIEALLNTSSIKSHRECVIILSNIVYKLQNKVNELESQEKEHGAEVQS